MTVDPGAAPAARERRSLALLLGVLVLATLGRWALRDSAPLNLHYDEAQYYAWSLHPAWGYFSKPPLIAWVIAATCAACGSGEFCLRLPAALALAGAALLVYGAARRLIGERAALAASCLFALAPLASFLALFMTTDSLLLLCWAAALYAFVRAVEGGGLAWWLCTGVAGGLGLLSKYTMGIFALSALGYLLGAPHRVLLRSAGPWLGAALAALIFAPNVAWNVAHRFATFGHTATISELDNAAADLGRLATFLAEQVAVFGPLTFAALVAALFSVLSGGSGAARWHGSGERRRDPARQLRHERDRRAVPRNEPEPASHAATGFLTGSVTGTPMTSIVAVPDAGRLLAWFTLPFLVLIAAQALMARAHANWAAPTYVAGSMLAASWLLPRTRRAATHQPPHSPPGRGAGVRAKNHGSARAPRSAARRTWLAGALILNLVLAVVGLQYRQIAAAAGIAWRWGDPAAQLDGWDQVGAQVAALLRQGQGNARLLANDRSTLSWLTYYARPLRADALVWNPSHRIENHFELLYDVASAPAGPFLFVSEREPGAALARQFAGVEALGPIEAGGTRGPKSQRRLYVYRLGRFLGYDSPR